MLGKTGQGPLWGTRAHAKRYGRRNAVETFNSLLAAHSHQRGYIRVFTQPRNALLLAFLHAAINLHQARIWRILHPTPSLDGPQDDRNEQTAGPTGTNTAAVTSRLEAPGGAPDG